MNFDVPTQVIFQWREEADNSINYLGGIGYNDVIICGCCGAVIPLDDEDLIAFAPVEWIDISESIKGYSANELENNELDLEWTYLH